MLFSCKHNLTRIWQTCVVHRPVDTLWSNFGSTETREQVKRELADLADPVQLVVFTQEFECQYCAETRQLVEEMA